MLPIRIAVVLAGFCSVLHAELPASPDQSVPTDPPTGAEKRDPLLEERDALYAEVRQMDAQINAIRDRERKARQGLREAVGERKNLLDPANVDKETAKLILRVQELEKELLALKVLLKEKLKNHPETVARDARMKTVGDDMQTLRAERTEIQQLKVKKVGRLRIIEQTLAERRKAAAEAAANAKAKAEEDADAVEAVAHQ